MEPIEDLLRLVAPNQTFRLCPKHAGTATDPMTAAGRLLQRLPVGNPSRADVSAFATLPIDEHLSHLIRQAAAVMQTRTL